MNSQYVSTLNNKTQLRTENANEAYRKVKVFSYFIHLAYPY